MERQGLGRMGCANARSGARRRCAVCGAHVRMHACARTCAGSRPRAAHEVQRNALHMEPKPWYLSRTGKMLRLACGNKRSTQQKRCSSAAEHTVVRTCHGTSQAVSGAPRARNGAHARKLPCGCAGAGHAAGMRRACGGCTRLRAA
eukprot:4159616-Prymnesium_polylepis.3